MNENSIEAKKTWSRMEDRIAQFENNWTIDRAVNILEFLPSKSDPDFFELLVEMTRIDMELAWDDRSFRTTKDYLKELPVLDDRPELVQQIAFEEYRLTCIYQRNRLNNVEQRKEERNRFASRYGVETEGWPLWELDFAESTDKASTFKNSAILARIPGVGSSFFGFDLIGLIGEGACGKVFLARQNDLANRLVCLKVTNQQSLESQHLARFQHSNIIPVFSVHQSENLTAVCMPFLGVLTLKDLINQAWKISGATKSNLALSSQSMVSTANMNRAQSVLETITDVDEKKGFQKQVIRSDGPDSQKLSQPTDKNWDQFVIGIAIGICEGLSHAHDKGMVHGDLKPANILLTDDTQPVLLDFHLSRSMEGLDDQQWVGGTLPYMSAEHLRSVETGEKIDSRSDIYSTGVVLFELLTGRTPFSIAKNALSDGSLEKVAENLESTEPPSILNSDLVRSVDLDSIVAKCICHDPKERYQNTDQLLEDLKRHKKHLPLRHAKNRSYVERARNFLRRHPKLTSATGIAGISLLILSLLSFALLNRNHRIASMDAIESHREFVRQIDETTMALPIASNDQVALGASMSGVEEFIARSNLDSVDGWRKAEYRKFLDESNSKREFSRIAKSNFWMAEGSRTLARLTTNEAKRSVLFDDALKYNLRATEFFRAQDIVSVAIEIQKKLILDEQSSEANSDLTDLLDLDNLLSKAMPRLSTAEDYLMATFLAKFSIRAPALADRLIQIDSQNQLAWILAGNIHSSSGNFALAETYYQMAISLAPEVSSNYWLIGRAQQDAGRNLKAIESYTRSLQLDPNNLSCKLNMGLLLLEMNEPAAADKMLTEAISEGSQNSRAWFIRSQIRSKLGMTREAQADMRKFVALNPSDEVGYATRGTYFVSQDPQKAIADFEMALKLNPNYRTAIQNLAHVYSEVLGDIPKAIHLMERLIEIEPDDPIPRLTCAVLKARQGDRQSAHQDVEAVLSGHDDAQTLYYSAGVFALTYQLEKDNGESQLADDDANKSIDLIRRAAFKDPQLVLRNLAIDPDIKSITELAEFKELVDLLANLK